MSDRQQYEILINHLKIYLPYHTRLHSDELFLIVLRGFSCTTRFFNEEEILRKTIAKRKLEENGAVYVYGRIPQQYDNNTNVIDLIINKNKIEKILSDH